MGLFRVQIKLNPVLPLPPRAEGAGREGRAKGVLPVRTRGGVPQAAEFGFTLVPSAPATLGVCSAGPKQFVPLCIAGATAQVPTSRPTGARQGTVSREANLLAAVHAGASHGVWSVCGQHDVGRRGGGLRNRV